MKKIFLTALTFVSMMGAQAQIKEGTVTYNINVENAPPEYAGMLKGMEMTVYFKNDKSKAEFTSSMQSTTTVGDENGSLTLVEAMGQKYFMKMSKADLEKESKKNPEPKITYSNETKTIAGYECKKAIIETKDKKGEAHKINVWYCEKLPITHGSSQMAQFKGLKGAPLEFDANQGTFKMVFAATKVSTAPVADSEFKVSTEGYTEMSMDQLKQMQGGGGK
ncbi:MAG: hypothetical protein JST67_11595 [Bacteroidetes bacterium]|nr:hypothetical protein [Bacteroidota bacterium]